jgi:glycosyltransferase involved in cell wall biosynthesis
LQLDLDDVESTTHGSLAHLYRLNGIVAESAAEERQAALYEEQEGRLLPKFDRVYVCSASDAARISGLVRGELQVLPNAIRPPLTPVVRRTSHPFTFLFVGTLGYFPNEDAVNWFCRDVLPVIREQAPAPFRVRIVGSGMPPSFAALARIEEVRLVGQVQDIAPEYAEADGVIVPIRGGGGTRIKILEAFAYQRPVVSTSAGAEGIDAEAERHLLVGDSASDFAAQSLRLMRDVELRQRLASEAYGLLLAEYSQARANQRLSGTA